MKNSNVCYIGSEGCVGCLKKRFSLFKNLSKEELALLNVNRIALNIKKGKKVFEAGEKTMGLICLNQGKVSISVEDDLGLSQIVSLKKEVEFLGFNELLSEKRYHTTATAITDVSVCIIDKEDFLEVVNTNSNLSIRIIQSLAKEVGDIEKRTVRLTQKNMRSRMAETILELGETYGYNEKKQLNVELKRKELANLSNMITANAIRTLSNFAKEKIIEIDNRKIWILSERKLRKIANEI